MPHERPDCEFGRQHAFNQRICSHHRIFERIALPDEELVCVTETGACCVDAVQALLGCSIGKGNLLLKPRGKTAMTFYHRPSQKAFRILWLANSPDTMSRAERMEWILSAPQEELLKLTPVPYAPPSPGRNSKFPGLRRLRRKDCRVCHQAKGWPAILPGLLAIALAHFVKRSLRCLTSGRIWRPGISADEGSCPGQTWAGRAGR